MRPPAQIEPWLDTEDLQTWVREAPEQSQLPKTLGHLADPRRPVGCSPSR